MEKPGVCKALPAFFRKKGMQELSLVRIEEVVAALESATTVQEIKNHIDTAKAAEVYAKQAKLGEDLKLKVFQYVKKAERKLGEMLAAAKAAGQITRGNKSGNNQYEKSGNVPKENNSTFTLEEAGISRKLSSRAQKLATIPKEDFDKAVAEGKEPKARKAASAPKRHDHASEVIGLHDAGATKPEIMAKTGLGKMTVRRIIDRARIEREAAPVITPDMLSLTAQQKLELAIKQYKAKLSTEFHATVNLRVQEFLENTIGPQLKREQAEARRIMSARKGIMNRKDYKRILACLHPDRVLDPERKPMYEEAFRIFNDLEKLVLNEKDSPTHFANIPTTPAEWEVLKRQAKERKSKSRTQGDLSREVRHRE
jgi:hypothetical protein